MKVPLVRRLLILLAISLGIGLLFTSLALANKRGINSVSADTKYATN